jgi:ABC-type polysaccharide/polyol phosphate export permease
MEGQGTVSNVTEVWRARELLINLTLRDVRSRYKRTLLGNAWSLINPLAMMAIYTLVFGVFLRVQPDKGDPSGLDVFALWLLCGLLPWSFLATGLGAGMTSLIVNANLVHKVYLPRAALVLSTVLAVGCTFLIEMGVLAAVLLLFSPGVLLWLPLVVVFIALLLVFVLGMALALSIATVYFRDVQHFVTIFLQLWFYLTPILYPISYVQAQEDRLAADGHDLPLVALLKLNPMEHFATVFRNLLYDNRFPALSDTVVCVLCAAAAAAIGVVVFSRFEGRLAEEL